MTAAEVSKKKKRAKTEDAIEAAVDVVASEEPKKKKQKKEKATEEAIVPEEKKEQKAEKKKEDKKEGADDEIAEGKEKIELSAKQLSLVKQLGFLYNDLISEASRKKLGAETLVNNVIEKVKECQLLPKQFGQLTMGSRSTQIALKYGTIKQREWLCDFFLADMVDLVLGGKAGLLLVQKIFLYAPQVQEEGSKKRELSKADKQKQEKIVQKVMEPLLKKESTIEKLFFHKVGIQFLSYVHGWKFLKSADKHRLLNVMIVPRDLRIKGLVDEKQSLKMSGFVNDARKRLKAAKESGKDTEEKPLFESGKSAEDQKLVTAKELQERLGDICEKLIDKEMLGSDFSHFVFELYTWFIPQPSLKHFMDSVIPTEALPHLLSTKSGAEAVIRLLGCASAKQRKTFVKECKGKFAAFLTNNVAYLVAARLFLTVDDTVLVKKQILEEVFADVDVFETYLSNNEAVKALMCLFTRPSKRFYNPYEMEFLECPAPSSMKTDEKRFQELSSNDLVKKTFSKVFEMRSIDEVSGACKASEALVRHFLKTNEVSLQEKFFAEVQAQENQWSKSTVFLLKGFTRPNEQGETSEETKVTNAVCESLLEQCVAPLINDEKFLTSTASFVVLNLFKRLGGKVLKKIDQKKWKQAIEKEEAAGNKVQTSRIVLEEAAKL